MLDALDPVVFARCVGGAMELPGERLLDDVVDERALARARDAGDSHERAERDVDRHVPKVVLARADDAQRLAGPRAARSRGSGSSFSTQILARQRCGVVPNRPRWSRGDDFAAKPASARSEVDNPVGATDGVFVVLDDHHRVAAVTEVLKRVQQLVVVAMVQTDRWLVEDVEDASQAGAKLGRESQPLGLAAGEAVGGPIDREIRQADIAQESQASSDLAEKLDSNYGVSFRQNGRGQEIQEIANGHTRE